MHAKYSLIAGYSRLQKFKPEYELERQRHVQRIYVGKKNEMERRGMRENKVR